jgi:heptosyltransferase-1
MRDQKTMGVPNSESDGGPKKGDDCDCRVLIVKLSSLGDLFHALPAVAALKERLGAEIDWCVQEEYVEVVKCFDDVSRVIPFPRRKFLKRCKAFRSELTKCHYDYVIDMQGLLKSCLVTLLANGDRKIGPSFSREGSSIFYREKAVGKSKGRHAVQKVMDVLRHLKLTPIDTGFRVTFPEVEVQGGRPRVALVPCSRWHTKNWPAQSFVDAAKRMLKSGPMSFYVVGGPGEVEACETIAAQIGSCASSVAGKYSIPESGGLLKSMDLVICNDSGPMHISAAVGTSVLAVFGPTDQVSTGPYGKGHRVLTADVDCRPCFSRKCRKGDLRCLQQVTPEMVSGAALEMLS